MFVGRKNLYLFVFIVFFKSVYAQNNCVLIDGDIVEQIKNKTIDCFNFEVEIPQLAQVYSLNNYNLVYSFINNNIDTIDQHEENYKAIANFFSYINNYFKYNVIQPTEDNQELFIDVANLIIKSFPTRLYKMTGWPEHLPPIARHINDLIIEHKFIDSIPVEVGRKFTRQLRFPRNNTQLIKRYLEAFLFDQHCLNNDSTIEFFGEHECDHYKDYFNRFDRAKKVFSNASDINRNQIANNKLSIRFFKNQSDWERFAVFYFSSRNLRNRSFYVVAEEVIYTFETPKTPDKPSYKKILTHEYLHHVHTSMAGKDLMNTQSFYWLRESFIEFVLLNDLKDDNPDKQEWLHRVKTNSIPSVNQLIQSSYRDMFMQYTFGPIFLNLLADDARYNDYFQRTLQVQKEKDLAGYNNLMSEMKSDEELQTSFHEKVLELRNN